MCYVSLKEKISCNPNDLAASNLGEHKPACPWPIYGKTGGHRRQRFWIVGCCFFQKVNSVVYLTIICIWFANLFSVFDRSQSLRTDQQCIVHNSTWHSCFISETHLTNIHTVPFKDPADGLTNMLLNHGCPNREATLRSTITENKYILFTQHMHMAQNSFANLSRQGCQTHFIQRAK